MIIVKSFDFVLSYWACKASEVIWIMQRMKSTKYTFNSIDNNVNDDEEEKSSFYPEIREIDVKFEMRK